VTTDIDTLATALYVKTDDLLKQRPDLAPWRPKIGLQPRLTDAELVTLAVMQALLGYASESRWLRYARAHPGHLFGYLPGQPGYNRRLRAAAGLITTMIRLLAADTSLWTDDVRVADSTPVECGRSRENSQALGPGRMGRIRILRQPFALLLGPAPAPGRHPRRPACGVRADRRQSRRAADTAGNPRR
jgi:hypothetical protein